MPLNTLKKILRYPLVQLALLCLASFILFAPIVSKSFASDDFLVLRRVALDRVLWIKGFFRPLSDITLFFNYLLGGFNPAGYYIFNILVHGVNSFLLFRFCLKWKWGGMSSRRVEVAGRSGRGGEIAQRGEGAGTEQTIYAFIATLLFLTYPFHSEGVAWVLGRACIVANLMGISALVILVSDLSQRVRIAGVCLCYFIGLASYESIMLLPLMVFVILYGRENYMRQGKGREGDRQQASRRVYLSWGIALGMTLAIHLVIRVLVSGGVLGSYGESFFGQRLLNYAGNIFRVTGRYFLPPSDNTHRMLFLFGLLLVALAVVVAALFKRYRDERRVGDHFLKLLILLALASVIPALFGVSTRTPESDRFLYFPSFFLCSCVAFVLVHLLRSRNALFFCVAILVVYQIVYLEKNNLNWLRASRMTKEIVGTVGRQNRQNPHAKIFLINLPDELNGAFIFRMGFDDALVMQGTDTARVIVVNHLTRDQMLGLPDSLTAENINGNVFIAPEITLSRKGGDSVLLQASGDKSYGAGSQDIVLYWDEHRLVKIK
jgi:hypothetical protein